MGKRRRHDSGAASVLPVRDVSPLAVRAAHLGLWALVVAGAVGGVVGATRSTAPTAAVAATDTDPSAGGIGGAAELAVRDWLSSGTVPGSSVVRSGRQPKLAVLHTSVVDERVVSDGYWAIVVAADVGVEGGGVARWFVEIGVVRSGDGYAVVSVPAVVAGPSTTGPARPAGPSLRVPPLGDDVVATVESFLRALVAGDGDLSRYLAPGINGQSVVPAPFATVRVARSASVERSAEHAVLRVEALAETATGQELVLGYEVRLAQRGGRWEVESFTGAPTLGAPPPADVDAPRTTSTTRPLAPTTTPPTTTASVALEPGA